MANFTAPNQQQSESTNGDKWEKAAAFANVRIPSVDEDGNEFLKKIGALSFKMSNSAHVEIMEWVANGGNIQDLVQLMVIDYQLADGTGSKKSSLKLPGAK